MSLIFVFMVTLSLYSVLAENIGDFGQDNALVNSILKNTAMCFSPAKLNFDTCLEMLIKGNDNSQAKYKDCKCAAACVSKKMKTMSDDGKWNYNKIQEYIDNLKTAQLKNEASRVFPLCKNTPGEGCDAAFQLSECAFNNSEMMKNIINLFLGVFKSGVKKIM